jgi:hypothetical protein
MIGTCPNDAVPPACYEGPKWTPNDPVFFMHHAVRGGLAACLGTCSSPRRIVVAQMIDKIWYDWQQKSPKNKYSYGGGSVEAFASFAIFTEFPTGLPPFLNVSPFIRFLRTNLWNLHTPHPPITVRQSDSRRRFMERYDLGRDGHDRRHAVLHLRLRYCKDSLGNQVARTFS